MRLCLLAAFGVLLAGCGDNFIPKASPLTRTDRLLIVAHPDDDLIFLQPELRTALDKGHSVTTVFVTAGQARKGSVFARSRQRGVLFAYQLATHTEGWMCGSTPINDRQVMTCRSDHGAGSETLVFLGLPDGGIDGSFPGSLTKLWKDPHRRVNTIGLPTATYTRADIIRTLADIVDQTHPSEIWTLDTTATYGDDHEDHVVVGAATVAAAALAGSNTIIHASRGYNITATPHNKSVDDVEADAAMLRAYNACVDSCGRCGAEPCSAISPFHRSLLERKRGYSLPASRGSGRLATDGRCLGRSGQMMPCAEAPTWLLADSQLRLAGEPMCLTAAAVPTVEPCRASPEQWWRMTDAGDIVSGNLALSTNIGLRTYAPCLLADGGETARVVTCGNEIKKAWQLLPP